MEIQILLNGQLKERTEGSREAVISQMRKNHQAELFYECLMRKPKNKEPYLWMRFVTPADQPGTKHA